MRTRSAVSADLPQLLALVGQYWALEGIGGFDAARTGELLSRLLAEPALGGAWVAEAEGVLLGYLVAVCVLSLEHGGVMAEIDEFYLVPAARGRGSGSALLQHAQADLRSRGCVRLQLQLGRDNTAGRAFYQRHGFTARAGYALWDKPLR
jgi:GNAT superfamily N-acetyltransferase